MSFDDGVVSLERTPKSARTYFTHLCQCMSLKDGVIYSKHHTFEKTHLLTLTPRDICKYFNLKVFGCVDPDESATSKLGRSSSLMFYKKIHQLFHAKQVVPMMGITQNQFR